MWGVNTHATHTHTHHPQAQLPPTHRQPPTAKCERKVSLIHHPSLPPHALSAAMAPSTRSYVWVVRLMVAVAVAAVAVLASPTSARQWKLASNGEVFYSDKCEFKGKDLSRSVTKDDDCGDLCIRTMRCTHFTWRNGFCYLKQGLVFLSNVKYDIFSVCGVRRRYL